MRRALIPAFLLLIGSTVLGATVFQEPIAKAASTMASVFVSNTKTSPVPVQEVNTDANGNIKVHEQGTANTREQNVDANGNIKVHEQGTATVSVSGTPNVNIANTTVPVHEQGTAAVRSDNEEVSIRDQIENDSGNSCTDNSVYTVPGGKELVIEYIGAQTSGGTTTSVFGHFGTSTLALLPLVFQQQVPGIFSASEAIHFVVPPSATLQFNGLEAGNSSCLFFAVLGGYLQPAS
jgi:hypothetical protein